MPDCSPFMDRALELAREAGARDEVPVGCVIVLEGKIIAEGSNTREASNHAMGHAEIEAIERASKVLGSWRLEGCSMICTLEPCLMCLATLQQARIEKLVYAARDPKGGALSLGYAFHSDERLNHRFEIECIPDPRAEEILKDFFRKKRKNAST